MLRRPSEDWPSSTFVSSRRAKKQKDKNRNLSPPKIGNALSGRDGFARGRKRDRRGNQR